ncbi:kinase-like protein [Trametopsis cervina]|nr:kinase-like protein [Trametopsis cervina]
MASPSSSRMQRPVDARAERDGSAYASTSGVVMTSVAKRKKDQGTKHMIVNQYELKQCLGKGQHGEVYIADDKITGATVAVKSVKRKNPKTDRMSQLRKRNLPSSPHLPLTDKLGTTEQKIRKEIAIMKKCNHPHVVRLLEVIDDELTEKIYMVMEYLGGGEIKWRNEQEEPILRVSQTRRICRDVILGLEYLHNNGIIHRDIKPANLLWSTDRRVVKIADFGVSHFSYAQRIATGNSQAPLEEILMNEADLFKFAGTPTFLAPEILYDSSVEASNSSSTASNLHTLAASTPGSTGATVSRNRPGITKAIDIWALGVTLYALLFGRLPFAAEGEWTIYSKIKDDDWDVRETMGQDKVPVGGRHQPVPRKGEETDGYLAVELLKGFLEKDPNRRITLDGVKHHPWILRDMPHADQWLRQTAAEKDPLAATDDETSSALSAVKFRWPVRFARGLYSMIRNVRSQRSLRRQPTDAPIPHEGDVFDRRGTRSVPARSDLTRQRSIAIGVFERDKERHRPTQTRNKSAVDVRTQMQSGSSQGSWRGPHSSSATDTSFMRSRGQQPPSPAADGSSSQPRRGSASGFSMLGTLQIPGASSNASSSCVSSPQPTPSLSDSVYSATAPHTAGSRTGSQDGQSASQERPRSGISVLTKWWRPASVWGGASTSNLPSGSTSPLSPTTPPAADFVRRNVSARQPTRDLSARRSEDAFQQTRQRPASQTLDPASRARSWGELGDYERPLDDGTSIYSGERPDEALDANTFLVGAGGIAHSPVSSVPSGILSTVSSTLSLGPPVLSAAHALLQRVDVPDSPGIPDPALQDPSGVQRQSQYRSHATSPLSQSLYGGSREDLSSSTFEQEENASSHESRTPSDTESQPNMSQLYHEDDEESESEESAPLEVRTRRPSWSVNDPLHSPPRRPDLSHED